MRLPNNQRPQRIFISKIEIAHFAEWQIDPVEIMDNLTRMPLVRRKRCPQYLVPPDYLAHCLPQRIYPQRAVQMHNQVLVVRAAFRKKLL